MVIQELLRHLVERAGSDLHLKVGAVPYVRIDGELVPTQFPELAEVDTERCLILREQRACRSDGLALPGDVDGNQGFGGHPHDESRGDSSGDSGDARRRDQPRAPKNVDVPCA